MRGDKLKGTLMYYLFKSLRELGIEMPLLFRRFSVIASQDVDYLSKEFMNGKIDASNFEQTVKDLSEMLKKEGLVESIEISQSDSTVELTVKGCTYLAMAEKARMHGEKTCPLCLISLAVSIPAMTAEGMSFNVTEYETDLENKVCKLKITHRT
ncbi:MAG: hypothetical protein ACP6IP_10130 [Candidatus Njordarchaeia archaeon]